jgi:hypothetical protein
MFTLIWARSDRHRNVRITSITSGHTRWNGFPRATRPQIQELTGVEADGHGSELIEFRDESNPSHIQ